MTCLWPRAVRAALIHKWTFTFSLMLPSFVLVVSSGDPLHLLLQGYWLVVSPHQGLITAPATTNGVPKGKGSKPRQKLKEEGAEAELEQSMRPGGWLEQQHWADLPSLEEGTVVKAELKTTAALAQREGQILNRHLAAVRIVLSKLVGILAPDQAWTLSLLGGLGDDMTATSRNGGGRPWCGCSQIQPPWWNYQN